jgi:DNA-binding transcriptional ArsR family regulator
MVKYSSSRLDHVLKALADPTRRGMLSRLAQKELTVGELAEPYEMSLAAISKHLKVLELADFIRRTKDGRTFRCTANLEPLREVSVLLEELGQFWRGRLDALDKFLTTNAATHGEGHEYKRKE